MAESPANTQPLVGPSPRYLAQVRAFLSYIEDVEVDQETIEDILTGLDEEFYLDSDIGGQSGHGADTLRNNDGNNYPEEDEEEPAQEGQVYFDANHILEELIWS